MDSQLKMSGMTEWEAIANTPSLPHIHLFLMSDACRSALGSDARINWRALLESFDMAQVRLRELVRSPLHAMDSFHRSMIKGLFASRELPGLVMWPSSAADPGEKARIV